MRRTGVVQDEGGSGVRVSSMRKSPLAWSGTPAWAVTCEVAVAAGPQNRFARTLWSALVPMLFPPASSRPRSTTRMLPPTLISAFRLRMRQGAPPGPTFRTVFDAGDQRENEGEQHRFHR
jgi:hypothetical protein